MEANLFMDDAFSRSRSLSLWRSLATSLSSLNFARSRACRESLLEADALPAFQPRPNSIPLSKIFGPRTVFVLLTQKPTALDDARAFDGKSVSVRADSSVSNHSPTRFCSGSLM